MSQVSNSFGSKDDCNDSNLPFTYRVKNISRSKELSARIIALPSSLKPNLPALPAIFLYSATVKGLPSSPKNSFSARITFEAGVFIPAATVVVATRTRILLFGSRKSRSTTALSSLVRLVLWNAVPPSRHDFKRDEVVGRSRVG